MSVSNESSIGEPALHWPAPRPEGENAPRFMLPDHGGAGWSLNADPVSGRPVVLLFFRGFADPDVLRELAEFRTHYDQFAAHEAAIIAVTRQTAAINAEEREAENLPFRVLSDLVGEISRIYASFAGPVAGIGLLVCVLSPALRIARILPGPAKGTLAAQALAAVAAITAQRPASFMAPHPPVLQIPGVLNAEECRFLIGLHERPDTPWNEPGDPEDRHDFKIRVGDHRRADRVDYVINDPRIASVLDNRLERRIAPEIKRAFQYRVTRRETYHLACYQGRRRGFSIGHRDNSTPDLAHRRFALSLNLNEGEYEGGELRFREYGEQCYRVPSGAAIIFSSSLLHEAMAVTAGRRFVLLSHLYGDDAQGAAAPGAPAQPRGA